VNWMKFMPKIGFAILLLSLSLSAKGYGKIADYILAGIIALAATILLLENISSKRIWKSIVRSAKSLDITYVAFGLGLMLTSTKFSSSAWAVLLLLVSGVVFSGLGIGKLIGTGVSDVIKVNAKVGIALGFLFLIVGVVVLILTWNSIIENPSSNAVMPIVIICVGVMSIYFGWKRWRDFQRSA